MDCGRVDAGRSKPGPYKRRGWSRMRQSGIDGKEGRGGAVPYDHSTLFFAEGLGGFYLCGAVGRQGVRGYAHDYQEERYRSEG